MRNKTLLAALIAVCLPASAVAAHPATPANSNANGHANGTSTTGTSSKANSNAQTKAIFVLHGTFGTYTPVNGSANGSIVVTVTAANHEATMLKGAGPLTFTISPSTKLAGTLKSGDKGIVKVRATKNASSATLQSITAFQVIDHGTTSGD